MAQDVSGFDKIFCRHIGFTLSQVLRSIIYGLTGGRLIMVNRQIPKIFQSYCRQLTRMSNAFTVLTDITLMVLGKRLKIKEALSGRLGDLLSYLCIAVSLLRYYQDRGQIHDEKIFMEWGVTFCFGKMQEAIMDFLANFPVRWIAVILRRFIFPWGASYSGPADVAAADIAQSLCQNLSLRERLTHHCYLTPESSAWQMEQAMQAVLKAEPLLAKLSAIMAKNPPPQPDCTESYLATQIRYAGQLQAISPAEREQLQTVVDLCWRVIQVDEFSAVKAKEVSYG